MTTYYVSSEIGSGSNAGTSASAPLASLQAAANLVKPGDTVLVMNGTYTAPYYGDALDITTSGTASAPITFAAALGQTPVIDSSGGWNAINIKASYITVKGFTVVGDAADYTLTSALAGYSAGSSELDGNGIAINPGSGVPLPNHIIIENNTVYNEPGGGIYTEGADYVQILNNDVHDNAHWSAFGNSGISVSTSANLDRAAGAHIVVSGNLVYNNAQLVPTDGAGKITDGEGIILDTNPNYASEILVQNNTVHNNGSSGVESFLTNNAVITGNKVYGNNTKNVQAADDAQIFINQSNNNSVTNNITSVGANDAAPTVRITSAGRTVSSAIRTITGTVDVADAGSQVTVLDGKTPIGTGTVDANGNWSASVTLINEGANVLTATDTNVSGTGTSAAVAYTLSPNAALTNGSFETGSFSGWTLSGNSGTVNNAQQIAINSNAESGAHAAGMGSMGSDGTLSQTIATTAGETYTLSFWLKNEGSGGNDFTATWNGQTLLSLTDAVQSGYTQHTYSVTAASSASTLAFSARNEGSQWDLDNVSLTANGTPSTPPTSGSGGSGSGTSGSGSGGSGSGGSANLVTNGSFETGSFSGWTLGGNSIWQGTLPEIYIDSEAQSGTHAAGMGSMGSDGTLSQTVATTAGKTYTLSFWLKNEGSGGNDFTASWNGQTLLSLTDAAQSGYKQYTYSVTASGSSSTLKFSAENNPSQWDLDNVSLVASSGASLDSSPIVDSSESLALNTPLRDHAD